MLLLAVDTSAAVTAAVHDGSRVLAGEIVHDPRRHAELLVPMIERVLAAAAADRSAVTDVAAGRGPGPFTGLRVGLVTARALGLALGVPVHGVGSLDALAQQVVDAGAAEPGEAFVVATDARRREVYWARYEHREGGVAHPLDEPRVDRPHDVELDGLRVHGRGALLHAEVLGRPADGPLDPDARALAAVAARRLAAGDDLSSTAPLYLRRPDAAPPGAGKSVLGR